jgi:hypothetical protein
MARVSTVPTIQSAIITSLANSHLSHGEIHKRVRSRVAFEGINPSAGSVRARTAELAHAGLVECKYTDRRGVKVWGLR